MDSRSWIQYNICDTNPFFTFSDFFR